MGFNLICFWEVIGLGVILVVLVDIYLFFGDCVFWDEVIVICLEKLEDIKGLLDYLVEI